MAILKIVEDWRAQRSQYHHFHCYHHYYVTQESITHPSIITILFYQSIGCLGLLWWLSGKEPGFRRPPGGGHSNPLKYSCLENPMERGDWWAAVHGVIKSQKQLKWTRTHARTGRLSLGSLWNQRFFSFGDIFLLALHLLALLALHLLLTLKLPDLILDWMLLQQQNSWGWRSSGCSRIFLTVEKNSGPHDKGVLDVILGAKDFIKHF